MRENKRRLQLFQNLSRELARNADKQPPLIETVELLDRLKQGEPVDLKPEDQKRLFVATYALTTVYFIAAVDAGMIKIGKTRDMKKRMATLRTMSPVGLEVVCTIAYDDSLEKRIHEHLKEYRAHGEWFYADKPVLDFIRGYRENGVRWVVDQVGEAGHYWMNNRGQMPDEMRLHLDFGSVYSDPDYAAGTQEKSMVDHR